MMYDLFVSWIEYLFQKTTALNWYNWLVQRLGHLSHACYLKLDQLELPHRYSHWQIGPSLVLYSQPLSIIYISEVASDRFSLRGIFFHLKAKCQQQNSHFLYSNLEFLCFILNKVGLQIHLCSILIGNQVLSFFLLTMFPISVLVDQSTSCPKVGGDLCNEERISKWLCFLQVLA